LAVFVDVAQPEAQADIPRPLREAALLDGCRDATRVARGWVAAVSAARERAEHTLPGAGSDTVHLVFASLALTIRRQRTGGPNGQPRSWEVGTDTALEVALAPCRAILVAATTWCAEPELAVGGEQLDASDDDREASYIGPVQALRLARLWLLGKAGPHAKR
jgi:hypothetical protein